MTGEIFDYLTCISNEIQDYEKLRGTMSAQTSMLHVRVSDQIKNEAVEKLEGCGLTLSDAVRILLTSIVREGGLPSGLIADNVSYDAWFKAKVREALNDTTQTMPHAQVMDNIQALIDGKRANAAS